MYFEDVRYNSSFLIIRPFVSFRVTSASSVMIVLPDIVTLYRDRLNLLLCNEILGGSIVMLFPGESIVLSICKDTRALCEILSLGFFWPTSLKSTSVPK